MIIEQPTTILGLDMGSKRIGVAIATTDARLPSPLVTLDNNTRFLKKLASLIAAHNVAALVVGLPRSLDGNDTAQTRKVRTFMAELRTNLGLPVHAQDEAATSLKAEEELELRGRPYGKGDVDSLAATYILDDFLQNQRNADV